VKINGLTKKGFVRARKQKAYKSMGVEGEGARFDGSRKNYRATQIIMKIKDLRERQFVRP
jgi:hypothetical protein